MFLINVPGKNDDVRIPIREIYCELTYGIVPRDWQKLRCCSTLSVVYYCASKCVKDFVLEIIDPTTGESLSIEDMDEVWLRHAEKIYANEEKMVDLKDAIRGMCDPGAEALHLMWSPYLFIRLVGDHMFTLPRYVCKMCFSRFFNPINRMRCQNSHPRTITYSKRDMEAWWDTLSREDRVRLVKNQVIVFSRPKDTFQKHDVKTMSGRTLVNLLDSQLEGTFLYRVTEIPCIGQISPVHRVASDLVRRFAEDQGNQLIRVEEDERKRINQKKKDSIVKSLMKKSVTSDLAFKQLTHWVPIEDWSETEKAMIPTN